MEVSYDSREEEMSRKYFFSQLGFIQYIENIAFASRTESFWVENNGILSHALMWNFKRN